MKGRKYNEPRRNGMPKMSGAGAMGMCRADGGKVPEKAGGNPAVFASAREDSRVNLGTIPGEKSRHRPDRKCGGRVTSHADGGKSGKWIQGAIKKPGALRESLDIPSGKTIPSKTLSKAAKSSNPTTRRRAVLAKTLKGFNK